MRTVLLNLLLLFGFISFSQDKPNIILILADDMGYSDIGAYGSEIATPNIDFLAQNGVRFRQFYNMAKCGPSRASLITGQNVGNATSIGIGEVMTPGGYFTIFTGKQHTESWMNKDAFVENSFTKSLFHRQNEYLIPAKGKMNRPFYLNGKKVLGRDLKWKKLPLFYKPDVMTDYAIAWMNQAKQEEKPIFLYMAYNTPHYPLQARDEDIAKYRDVYRVGWDEIREKRYNRMMELGVLNDKYTLTEPLDNIHPFYPKTKDPKKIAITKYRPWDSLTDQEKDELSLEMAVYAAMVDRMDQNIGRLLDWVREKGDIDNTLIIFLTDNGPSPYDSNRTPNIPPGGAESFRSQSTPWANVAATPFKYYKQYGHEGGNNTHFIIHWPKNLEKGEILDGPGHITDLFPTILDAAGLEYPEKKKDQPTLPLIGRSLIPMVAKGEIEAPPFMYTGHGKRMRSYRVGEWKIVRAMNGPWELYNMNDDPSESNDLAAANPQKVAELEAAYLAVEMVYDKYKGTNYKDGH